MIDLELMHTIKAVFNINEPNDAGDSLLMHIVKNSPLHEKYEEFVQVCALGADL